MLINQSFLERAAYTLLVALNSIPERSRSHLYSWSGWARAPNRRLQSPWCWRSFRSSSMRCLARARSIPIYWIRRGFLSH